MKNELPNNECGGCTACCTVIPVISPEFCKPVGKTCEHVYEKGCGIYQDRPPVCRDWLCSWRADPWLGSRPEYRPDRLGVMFTKGWDDRHGEQLICAWEVKPGALQDPRVAYIMTRIKNRYQRDMGSRCYPLGVLDNDPCTPDMAKNIKNGSRPFDPDDHDWRWVKINDKDYIAVKKEDSHA